MVPLSAQALEILQALHEFTGDGRLIFPGLRSAQVPISDATFIAALRHMRYDKDEMTAHGFRAMASTLLNEQGYSAEQTCSKSSLPTIPVTKYAAFTTGPSIRRNAGK
jgi:integrase